MAKNPRPPKQTSSTVPVAPNPLTPTLPTRSGVDQAWASSHQSLHDGVKLALLAMADGFDADIQIAGMDATDLFGLNSVLGSAIERHVVEALNKLRSVWDPANNYATYTFVRFPQSFPDVRLVDRNKNSPLPVLMGIELKGWFTLAKEGVPSFRFEATPNACNSQDLIVVVPWVFNNVLSGKPRLLTPYIEEARYVAELRNHHWTWIRGKGLATDQVSMSSHVGGYPSKSAKASDKAVKDKGKNFGRIARTSIMSDYISQILENEAAGIPLKYWVQFLGAFTESDQKTDKKMELLVAQIEKTVNTKDVSAEKIASVVSSIAALFADKD